MAVFPILCAVFLIAPDIQFWRMSVASLILWLVIFQMRE